MQTTQETTGQQSFVALMVDNFGTSANEALIAFNKLRSFMQSDRSIAAMYASAERGDPAPSPDDVYDRTQKNLVGLNIRSVFRAVVLPIVGGVLAYVVAGATLVAGEAILVGLLVFALLYLMFAPGALASIKARIKSAIDDIFSLT